MESVTQVRTLTAVTNFVSLSLSVAPNISRRQQAAILRAGGFEMLHECWLSERFNILQRSPLDFAPSPEEETEQPEC